MKLAFAEACGYGQQVADQFELSELMDDLEPREVEEINNRIQAEQMARVEGVLLANGANKRIVRNYIAGGGTDTEYLLAAVGDKRKRRTE